MAQAKTAISPTRSEDYPEWYQQVIRAAELAENSPVRGCMVIKPWGYALWENMQRVLDDMFKSTGHRNAYFPLFIPLSYLEKEAEHVEGFAKECAVVTHHRLIPGQDGGLIPDPDAKLEEPLVVRPTSETIIGETFARWIESYRDLPLLINQWANVVRWELRTRLFLRTTEFLWQEGHTAHATAEEAQAHTLRMLNVYADFAEDWMAMPVIRGRKTEGEKFPGAVETYSIEAMMQDGKALQSGTSHFLGQNFAKSSGIQFLNEQGERVHAWTTSWGVSTRLIGGLIMTHSDDDGLVLPPRLAPAHVVIVPILHTAGEQEEAIRNYCQKIVDDLRMQMYHGRPIVVEFDDRDMRGGDKVWSWIKKGAPLRIEIGPRDFENDAVFVGRRDRGPKEKQSMQREAFIAGVVGLLDEIQQGLYDKALALRESRTRIIDTKDEFYDWFQNDDQSGFALTHFCGDPAVEATVKNDLAVTVRCVPIDKKLGGAAGECPFTGSPSPQRVVWARSY
ncbi:MAG: proline--tRNA ligase [Phycisphaerales bacterium]